MARNATTTGAERLVHCSPDRTVFSTTIDGGKAVLCKLFVRGSLADAEREVAIARLSAGQGVAGYQQAGKDPASALPRILCDFYEGTDLAELVRRHGALPATRAARLLSPVAHTLARLHDLRIEQAPFGICHGDVKPGNLLATAKTTLLLDFEHARPISTATGEADPHPVGTTGFAAPEAAHGAPPSPALDVFGIGATLRWLLTGGGVTEMPQDATIETLVTACTDEDPRLRPSAQEVATVLDQLARRLADDHEEELLSRLAQGERLEFVNDLPRFTAMRRLAAKQRRILAHLPNLLSRPDNLPDKPSAQRVALHHAQRVLRWFPRHEPVLQWRNELAKGACALLASVAATTSRLEQGEQFDLAARWLDEALALAGTLLRLPGMHRIPGTSDVRAVGLLQRDPPAFLQRLIDHVADARDDLESATADIDGAEERLDLIAAEDAIDAMAERYGGASPTAAKRRDQLNRLSFYVDRIASAQGNADRIAQLWDRNALSPLLDLVHGCGDACVRSATAEFPSEPLGLRSLQVALINLAEEFPHLYVRSGPALEALTQALHHTSDLAWELLDKAQGLLEAVPVPVRPLQLTFGRIDTFRILEALVDRPDRPRSRLLDAIEGMRLKFEQARAARDRLAQGAEQAMARGHWTTGLFDMERVVAGLNPADETERAEAERLQTRLAEAKRQKEEIDAAVRRNVELGTRFGHLQDEAESTFEQRLQVLEERRACLDFLAANLPEDRATLYSRDLREVELQITLERAEFAETEFDSAESESDRLRVAQRTLGELEAAASSSGFGENTPGRLQRVRDHWRTLTERYEKEQALREQATQRQVRTRRRALVGALATLIGLIGLGWATSPWLFGDPAQAAQRTQTLDALRALRAGLPDRSAAAADALLAVVRTASRADTAFDLEAWHLELEAALVELGSKTAGAGSTAVRTFTRECWRTGLDSALPRIDEAGRAWLEKATTALAGRVKPFGIAAPR